VGGPAGIFASAVLLLSFAMFKNVFAAAPPLLTPAPTVSTQQLQETTSALRAAILVDHQQSILPDGYVPGELTTAQTQQLDDRIVGAYTEFFSGEALARRLRDLRNWALDVSTRPVTRTLLARLDRLDIASADNSADGLVLTGTSMIYQVTAQGPPGADELIWGGWVTNSGSGSI
jgi:hypothetical protein